MKRVIFFLILYSLVAQKCPAHMYIYPSPVNNTDTLISVR